MKCRKCKWAGDLIRMKRAGFLEQKVYPLFGYYPWKCSICGVKRIIKFRGDRRRTKLGDPSRGRRKEDRRPHRQNRPE